MAEGNTIDGINIPKTPRSCCICHGLKDPKTTMMMNSGCPIHPGYACYTCLRKHYIEKPKTVYDFPLQCSSDNCHHYLPHNWIQSFFAKGRNLGLTCRRSKYCQMVRLARKNQQILGSNWRMILKNLRDVSSVLGIKEKHVFYGEGFSKCSNCQTIVLKAGGCDHMTCPSCEHEYSFFKCKLNIDQMDIGTVRLASDRVEDNRMRRPHIRPSLRLATVMEDAATLWEEGDEEIDGIQDNENLFVADSIPELESDVDMGETMTTRSSGIKNNHEDDDNSNFGDGSSFSAIDVDAEDMMGRSWSVVSSGEQTLLSSSAASSCSFSVISGIESVFSFDNDFGDLASIDDSITSFANDDDGVGSLSMATSYCDVVKRSKQSGNIATSVNIPRSSGSSSRGVSQQSSDEKITDSRKGNKANVDNDNGEDDDFFTYDVAYLKYNGRGQSLKYCGGRSISGGGQHESHTSRGSKQSRKERKARRIHFLSSCFYIPAGKNKGRHGQRCGFQTTKSAVQRYYGIN